MCLFQPLQNPDYIETEPSKLSKVKALCWNARLKYFLLQRLSGSAVTSNYSLTRISRFLRVGWYVWGVFKTTTDFQKLKIIKTALNDAGKYICRASNLAGSTDIDLTLKILVPPKIDESNVIANPIAILDRSIYLECPVTAIPQPTIHWLKDGRPIEYDGLMDPENSKFSLQQSNQTFGIRNVKDSDRGVYACVVTVRI